jgi:hypothetical protein
LQLAVEQAALQSTVSGVDLELPLAVETQPVRSNELWAWVFGSWDVHRTIFLYTHVYHEPQQACVVFVLLAV